MNTYNIGALKHASISPRRGGTFKTTMSAPEAQQLSNIPLVMLRRMVADMVD